MGSAIAFLARALLGALLIWPSVTPAGNLQFAGTFTLTATADRLRGEAQLQLLGSDAAYNVDISVLGQAQPLLIPRLPVWPAGAAYRFPVDLPSPHAQTGRYHALIEIRFQDKAGAWLGTTLAAEYHRGTPPTGRPQAEVAIRGDRLEWRLNGAAAEHTFLQITGTPAWIMQPSPARPTDNRLNSEPLARYPAQPNWTYKQLARLDWVRDDVHDSRILAVNMVTDRNGRWDPQAIAEVQINHSPRLLWSAAGLLVLLGVWRSYAPRTPSARRPIPEQGIAHALLALLTVWLYNQTAPGHWFTPTWTTGGDTASHVYYAAVFRDWLLEGKLSGWLPESFAGFPAFTYYFPLPFALIALTSLATGLPIAFKFGAMLPALLLPVASYFTAGLFGWPTAARLFAAAATAGFILTDQTSIWGGNLQAQLAGEFSYAWGMVFAVLFWGVLTWALNAGGRRWLWAALLESAVALCHGYALLMAGFGALLLPLLYGRPGRDLRIVLQVHVLAFLMIGFWLLPLIQNLPWTIPNDGNTWVEDWRTLWPRSLWPLALGLLLLPLVWARIPPARAGLACLGGITALALLGFFGAWRLGLADIRFFPYAQWAVAVAGGTAVGWAIQHWARAPLAWTAAALVGLMAWWEPGTATVEAWSRWNLSGYETKALWPAYRELAATTAGPRTAPRVAFEHDPANNDIGSNRALEALPLFGARPVLEGLYMESALSGPFIYQLQAEISAHPSSPLARFPARQGSVDQAVAHMHELYTDTLILRSDEMQARFVSDPRFETLAAPAPFLALRLKHFPTQMVEPLSTPVEPVGRQRWLETAFHRFLLEHPYATRYVFLAPDQQWEAPSVAPVEGAVRMLTFDRERLVFETQAVGQPHLIRMTYHPRWRSSTGETVYLTEPTFMLVVPRQARVELVYAWGWADWLGAGFTLLGAGLLLVALVWGALAPATSSQPGWDFMVITALLVAASVSAWYLNPERGYRAGHALFAAGRVEEAAIRFEQAYEQRRARKAEALFWAARSRHLAKQLGAAEKAYRTLSESYPESYWAAETLFRRIEIHMQAGEFPFAKELLARLMRSHPNGRWTAEARKIIKAQTDRSRPDAIVHSIE